jgi:hypothetical protein
MPEPYCHAATAALLAPDQEIRLPVWLAYHPYDCLAVRLTFWTYGAEGVTWVFDWELLAAGLTGPAGEGDVRVAPTPGAPGRVMLRLGCGPQGRAYLELAAADVECFVTEAARRCRRDRAAVAQALDGELARILECA